MYIGIGTVVLIVIIVLVILMLRRLCPQVISPGGVSLTPAKVTPKPQSPG